MDGKILGKDIDFPPSIGVLLENPAFLAQYTGFENLKLIAALNGTADDTQIRAALERVTKRLEDNYGIERQFYSMGEVIELGDNYMDIQTVSVDGYSIRVDKAEVMSREQLLARLGQTESSLSQLDIKESDLAEKICLVTITLANEYCTGPGIDLSELTLHGINYDMFFDNTFTVLANSFLLSGYQQDPSAYMGMLGVYLDPGESTEICLVYDFYKGYFSARQWERLEQESLLLDLTDYPVKKTVEISLA